MTALAIAISSMPPVVNACTFLGGSGGVAGGAIAFTLGASSVC